MRETLHERRLLLYCTLLVLTAFIGHFFFPLTPDVAKVVLVSLGLHAHLGSHYFADTRIWLGIPNAADVLSNLPFAVFGVLGLIKVRHHLAPNERFLGRENFVLALFFAGLLFTTGGSMLYHLFPNDETLLWDRTGMAFAFAGMLGIAVSERVSARSGIWLGLASLLAGALALQAWFKTGDVLPWMVLQFGCMMTVLILAITRPHAKSLGVSLYAVVAWYALAKVFESFDTALYEITNHLASGHTLKHLVAACAAWPVIRVLSAKS
jgi:hypothetical protein